ncbi:proline--tRNA ligase [Fusibacter paucivorans]|uniref:Proline--tRNA ligase n=1 Tax=Fusibacter paucivorans TaxID=76009 RepID=A0ABS5PRS1_9FIRM|nr:proline--tRNA ligase [Fusibacter paucivorans]MBS7527592.1 proline--tRNA ligase [Fusibacter paucivorans]
MATKDSKAFVKDITPMEEDFAQWYTDVIRKTDLVDYSPVKGFMVIKPYGYALWENIQQFLDRRFKETGHENCYFPLLIPESLLNKEKEHVEGFAPEVAWVTHGGSEPLGERLCVRPTSETIICSMYSKWLTSYRELPYLYNQWCSVVRWEKATRPFLRTSEFLWQEGHTLHETAEEAQKETLQMLDIYREMAEDLLAIPMVVGRKSDREKFAGAEATYTIEALMHDGKALQSGTSHNLAQHFTKAFDITYQGRNGDLENPHHTSWGASTRLIGGVIMVHGDNRGLVLPPRLAPIQVVIVPIAQKKPGVLERAEALKNELIAAGIRVKLDDSTSNSPGWKFNEYEMKGVPLRVEIGPRDIENGVAMVARRDNHVKESYALEGFAAQMQTLLDQVHGDMLERARASRDEKTFTFETYEEFKQKMAETPGFAKTMWCGDEACEANVKADTGVTIRCIPFEQENLGDTCPFCGKPAKEMVYMAKAY